MEHLRQTSGLDELVRHVCARLDCAGVLVTQIMTDHQIILANSGMSLPQEFASSMTFAQSICQHTQAMDFPLVIDDVLTHPLLADSRTFADLGLAAYLGAPVHVANGEAIGALCAVDVRRRRWEAREIKLITDAALVADELLSQRA